MDTSISRGDRNLGQLGRLDGPALGSRAVIGLRVIRTFAGAGTHRVPTASLTEATEAVGMLWQKGAADRFPVGRYCRHCRVRSLLQSS